jgi:hypothetical protein
MKKSEELEIQRDIAMTDILVRLTALEQLLLESKVINRDKYMELINSFVKEIDKKFKEATDNKGVLSVSKKHIPES